jgi:predicted enzyme related to lactoylglutathione lyase
MKQMLHFITINVKDLEGMKDFYKNIFGWRTLRQDAGMAFFNLNGFILSLFPENELADDIGIENDGEEFKRITFSINFNSEREANEMFQQLELKKVKIVNAPAKVFRGGYTGYIADPENNYWEPAHNPFLKLAGKGLVIGHE